MLNYLSGLNFFLRQHGAGEINYNDYIVKSTLKGIRRQKGDIVRQASPLLPSMLLCIFALLTLNPGHVAWRAAMLCSFRALLRKSQVTLSDSSPLREDCSFHNRGMLIRVCWSKIIQFKERVLEVPVARCINKELCAVYWTSRHFRELETGQGMWRLGFP